MATFHSRSNSLPSKSNQVMECVEDHLYRLKSSEGTSTSATSVCAKLTSLTELHENINNLIHMPSFQQAMSKEQGENWINELLEGSLRLVDLCGLSRDILCLTKESVQDLESSMRRNKVETVTAVEINAYVASRKKIIKIVNKCLENLKSFNQGSTVLPDRDDDLKAIGTMLKETEALGFSVLNSVLILLSGEKERSNQTRWSFLSKFTRSSRVYSEVDQETRDVDLCSLNIHMSQKSMDNMTVKNILKQLNSSEMIIQELDERLESLFRSLVKTRDSLLNVLSH